MADLRIDNGVILTLDPERRIIKDGSIVIDKDRITDVGKTKEMKGKYKATRVIDAKRKLLIPGLVNMHIHFYHHMHKGLAPEALPIWQWSKYVHGHFASLIESEHEIYGALAVLLETLRSGTTCFLEAGSYHPYELMDAIGRIGVKGWMGKRVFDQGTLGPAKHMETTEGCLSFYEKFMHQ